MYELESQYIDCPFCGETIEVLIDCSVSHQNYIEDCQVCCRPITLDVSVDEDGEIAVYVSDENA